MTDPTLLPIATAALGFGMGWLIGWLAGHHARSMELENNVAKARRVTRAMAERMEAE